MKSKTHPELLFFFKCVVFTLLGFFFSRTALAFETRPLGIALLCSLPGPLFPGVIGYLLGIFVPGSGYEARLLPLYAACGLAVYLARIIVSKRIISRGDKPPANAYEALTAPLFDPRDFRLWLAAAVCAAVFAVRLISGDALWYDIFAGLFLLASAVVSTFFLSAFFDARMRYSPLYEAGFAALCFYFVLSLAPVSEIGFSFAKVFGTLLTLLAAYDGGIMRGGAVGFLCGLAISPAYAAIYGLTGLCAGVFFPLNLLVCAAVTTSAAVCAGAYIEGFENIMSFLPELAVAEILLTVPASFSLIPREWIYRFDGWRPDKEITAAALLNRDAQRLRAISDTSAALSSLSEILGKLSCRLRKPTPDELEALCAEVFSDKCGECMQREHCHGAHGLSRSLRRAVREAGGGKINKGFLPEEFASECPLSRQIASALQSGVARLTWNAAEGDKTAVLISDYGVCGDLLSQIKTRSGEGAHLNTVLTGKLRSALGTRDFAADDIAIYGARRKTVIAAGQSLLQTAAGAEELREVCERICKSRFSSPQYSFDKSGTVMLLRQMRKFDIRCGYAQRPRRGESVCGDTYSQIFTESGNSFTGDRFYSYICDGMGSGVQAALSSKLCRVFLDKLLACGTDVGSVLEMLGNFLLSKPGESFSTVDIFAFDMVDGSAEFIKCGAAPSYILRGGRLHRIFSATQPLGITDELSAEKTAFEMKEGDIVVLCSDGVSCPLRTEAFEEAENPDNAESSTFTDGALKLSESSFSFMGSDAKLLDILSRPIPKDESGMTDAGAFARIIAEEAEKYGGGGDDITVAVAVITAAQTVERKL